MLNWSPCNMDRLTGIPYLENIQEIRDSEEESGLILNLKFDTGSQALKFELPRLFRIRKKYISSNELSQQNLDDKSWLFTVNESELMHWFHKESYGILPDINHFVIITQEQVIDIFTDEGLTDFHPKIISTEQ